MGESLLMVYPANMVQAFAVYSGPFVREGLEGVNSDEYSGIQYGTTGICSWVPHD